MLQSYKTNKRAAWLRFNCKFLVWLLLQAFFLTTAFAVQTGGKKRDAQFFDLLQYRFQVPEKEAEKLWVYLENKYSKNAAKKRTEDKVTEQYYDDAAQTMRKHNVVLRQRQILASDGRERKIQLLQFANGNTASGKKTEFRHNRKPDKNPDFTTHPLIKLLRTRDRPILDSLLRPYLIPASDLKPVLEVTQSRQHFYRQKDGSDWITITLTEIHTGDNSWMELQLLPDKKLLSFSAPAVKKQLRQETQNLAAELQKQFPALQPETRTDYDTLLQMHKKSADKKISTNLWVAGILIFLIAIYLFLRKFRKKHPDALS